jgi:hypothetical protein
MNQYRNTSYKLVKVRLNSLDRFNIVKNLLSKILKREIKTYKCETEIILREDDFKKMLQTLEEIYQEDVINRFEFFEL